MIVSPDALIRICDEEIEKVPKTFYNNWRNKGKAIAGNFAKYIEADLT